MTPPSATLRPTDVTADAAADAAEAACERRGRPRSEERHQVILDAALAALVEEGYDAMTVEGVAARAGAGKATLYRRWRSKAELVGEAIARHACGDVPLVDTGDVRADLLAFLRALQATFDGVDGALMAAIAAERIRHPELVAEFDRRFVDARRAHLRRLLSNAVARGELPATTDVDLLADIGPAVLLHDISRRADGRRRDLPERIVAQLLGA